MKQAVGSAELLITTGFPLVLLDLGTPPVPGGRGKEASWLRLARAAQAHRGALLVSSPYRASGTAATAVVEISRGRAAWWSSNHRQRSSSSKATVRGSSPYLLAGVYGAAHLEKGRARLKQHDVEASLLNGSFGLSLPSEALADPDLRTAAPPPRRRTHASGMTNPAAINRPPIWRAARSGTPGPGSSLPRRVLCPTSLQNQKTKTFQKRGPLVPASRPPRPVPSKDPLPPKDPARPIRRQTRQAMEHSKRRGAKRKRRKSNKSRRLRGVPPLSSRCTSTLRTRIGARRNRHLRRQRTDSKTGGGFAYRPQGRASYLDDASASPRTAPQTDRARSRHRIGKYGTGRSARDCRSIHTSRRERWRRHRIPRTPRYRAPTSLQHSRLRKLRPWNGIRKQRHSLETTC